MAKQKADQHETAKIAAVATIAAAIIAALITGIFALAKPEKPDRPGQTSGDITGNCNQISGTGIEIDCGVLGGQQPEPADDQTPAGSGPWPFKTVNTWAKDNSVDHGAVVRPCPDKDCGCQPGVLCRLGVDLGNVAVYARCQQHSTFTGKHGAAPRDTVWIKVAWPNTTITATKVFVSSPSDRHSGWIIGSSLEPQGHNGDIPACT